MKVGGRPLKYSDVSELTKVINEYFGKTDFEQYTITGLALAVGSKQLVQDYEKREGYGDVIREAKLIIEHSYELALRKTRNTNYIFALKNFGWSDKQEIETTITGLSIPGVIINGKSNED